MKYNLIGQRFLRKYTADSPSPSYNASTDAATVVDRLCRVPWEPTNVIDATITSHTDKKGEGGVSGLDGNVTNRESFDAALFCANHVGGNHRAYANAACYRYVLPEGTLPKLTKLTATVTSDPYNSLGARIVVMTNATGEIPMACATVRGDVEGGIKLEGVAVRETRTVDGKDYWYPTTEDAVFDSETLPEGGLQLQKYLMVFVLLENYSAVRGNWLEGSCYIRNNVEIETDAAMPEWTEGETEDLSSGVLASMAVVRDGILPCIVTDEPTGGRRVVVRTDAGLIVEQNGVQTPSEDASGEKAAAALGRLYNEFFSGRGDMTLAPAEVFQKGAMFNVLRTYEKHVSAESDIPENVEVLAIESEALVVPFVWPQGFVAGKVSLEFGQLTVAQGARFNVYLAGDYMTHLDAAVLNSPGLYDGQSPPFTLLGTISGGTEAKFALPESHGRAGSIVITGWLDPDAFDIVAGGRQGTGESPFVPNITITE